MTVREAIDALKKMSAKHGDDTPVYFDCPHCGTSFEPGKVVPVAVHITGKPKEAR